MPGIFVQTITPREIFLETANKNVQCQVLWGFCTLRIMYLQFMPKYFLYEALIYNIAERITA